MGGRKFVILKFFAWIVVILKFFAWIVDTSHVGQWEIVFHCMKSMSSSELQEYHIYQINPWWMVVGINRRRKLLGIGNYCFVALVITMRYTNSNQIFVERTITGSWTCLCARASVWFLWSPHVTCGQLKYYLDWYVIAHGVVSPKNSNRINRKGDLFLTRHVGRGINTKKELIGWGH